MLKLNNRGIGHFLLLAVLVLGLGIFGTYKMVANTSQVAITSTCTSKVLRVGAKGTCVRQVQEQLNITADGDFGPKTYAAVKQFQSQRGLTTDGVVGPKTWAQLKSGSRQVNCTYRMKADNTEVVAQGMEHSKCLSLGGKVVTTGSTKVTAQSAAKPKPVSGPTPSAKPTPRAADGRQVYCTYRGADNTIVKKSPMSSAQCKSLKGRATTTPPKIACAYTTKSGQKLSKELGNAKACEAYQLANSYGICDVQTGPDRKETKKKCASHKASSPTGTGTWREF